MISVQMIIILMNCSIRTEKSMQIDIGPSGLKFDLFKIHIEIIGTDTIPIQIQAPRSGNLISIKFNQMENYLIIIKNNRVSAKISRSFVGSG